MNKPMDECRVKEYVGHRCISQRCRTSVSELPRRFQEVLGCICGEVFSQSHGSAIPTGAPFAVYRNTDMNDLDVEIGVPADGSCELPDSLAWSETPMGTFATCIYRGPYNQMESTYQKLTEWAGEHHKSFSDPMLAMEIYRNDPDQTPPEELETEILLLLK